MANRYSPYGPGAGGSGGKEDDNNSDKKGEGKGGGVKTRLCKNFSQGNCSRGDQCTFAHGAHEIPGYKSKLCTDFQSGGECSRGAECSFAHGMEELKKWLFGAALMFAGKGCKGGAPDSMKGTGFKTQLCRYWEQSGKCHQGDRCTYAHGQEELDANRKKSEAMKEGEYDAEKEGGFKTAMCMHFVQGVCTKGSECSFAHGAHEIQGYKTKLCKNFEESKTCDRGDLCSFAHGAHELQARPKTNKYWEETESRNGNNDDRQGQGQGGRRGRGRDRGYDRGRDRGGNRGRDDDDTREGRYSSEAHKGNSDSYNQWQQQYDAWYAQMQGRAPAGYPPSGYPPPGYPPPVGYPAAPGYGAQGCPSYPSGYPSAYPGYPPPANPGPGYPGASCAATVASYPPPASSYPPSGGSAYQGYGPPAGSGYGPPPSYQGQGYPPPSNYPPAPGYSSPGYGGAPPYG